MAEIMTAHVRPWGNSHGIRITKEMMYVMNLKPNDSLQIIVEGDSIILKKAVNRKTLQEYASDFGGVLGPYDEFDWGSDIGIERWINAED